MPNRVLRDGIIESVAVNALSDDGELLYRRLMSVVDDYGRLEYTPEIIRARCFPLRLEQWPVSRVEAALTDIGTSHVGPNRELVSLYTVSGKKYLQINNFGQRIRAKTSKCPEPYATVRQMVDGQMTVTCQTSAAHARVQDERRETRDERRETRDEGDARALPSLVTTNGNGAPDPESLFSRMWAAAPKKTNRHLAEQALVESLALKPGDESHGRTIERVWLARCETEEWREQNGRFAPQLHRWLADHRWEDGPPARASPAQPLRQSRLEERLARLGGRA